MKIIHLILIILISSLFENCSREEKSNQKKAIIAGKIIQSTLDDIKGKGFYLQGKVDSIFILGNCSNNEAVSKDDSIWICDRDDIHLEDPRVVFIKEVPNYNDTQYLGTPILNYFFMDFDLIILNDKIAKAEVSYGTYGRYVDYLYYYNPVTLQVDSLRFVGGRIE